VFNEIHQNAIKTTRKAGIRGRQGKQWKSAEWRHHCLDHSH